MNADRIESVYRHLPADTQAIKRVSLLRSLRLARLREQHMDEWRAISSDDDRWDAWLRVIGLAALELADSYTERAECESGTGNCGCYGCEVRELESVIYDASEGRATSTRQLRGQWTQGECLRRGLELHAWWVNGVKRKTPKPQISNRPSRGLAFISRGRK